MDVRVAIGWPLLAFLLGAWRGVPRFAPGRAMGISVERRARAAARPGAAV